MYQQVYLPRLGVPAVRGYCLGYVDDAGSAPNRSDNAKIAYDKEKAAGRIKLTTPPKGVWVVGFMAFTKGSLNYGGTVIPLSQLGHVFFMKYLGDNKYSIYDSEVASGAKGPYPHPDAVKAWFAAYGPIYTGWSVACDGRTYAKKESTMIDKFGLEVLYRLYLGRLPDAGAYTSYVGKFKAADVAAKVRASTEYANLKKAAAASTLKTANHLPDSLRSVYKPPVAAVNKTSVIEYISKNLS